LLPYRWPCFWVALSAFTHNVLFRRQTQIKTRLRFRNGGSVRDSSVLPWLLSCSLLVGAFFLVASSTSSRNREMGPPRIERLADLEGVETEVAIAPDGTQLIAVSSGDLWLLNTALESRDEFSVAHLAEVIKRQRLRPVH
jgi:hypothetical protein